MKEQLDTCFTRAQERRARREDEDYDEQVEEELEEEDETDEQYLRKVADIMHALFGTHGSTLLPFFDELLPTFAGMLVRCGRGYGRSQLFSVGYRRGEGLGVGKGG